MTASGVNLETFFRHGDDMTAAELEPWRCRMVVTLGPAERVMVDGHRVFILTPESINEVALSAFFDHPHRFEPDPFAAH